MSRFRISIGGALCNQIARSMALYALCRHLSIAGAASAADVHVMISAGFYGVYSELGPAFERASGHRLITTRGPSMGDSPEAIPTRLARGETADVVIMDGGSPTSSAGEDWYAPTARSTSPAPKSHGGARRGREADIGSVEAFRRALLAAKSIAYSDSGSGTYLSTTLFAKLGVADQVAARVERCAGRVRRAGGRGRRRGEAEIAFRGQRADTRSWRHFRRGDSGRAPAGVFFAGALTSTARQPGPPVRCFASSQRRGGADDLEGRANASIGTVARKETNLELRPLWYPDGK